MKAVDFNVEIERSPEGVHSVRTTGELDLDTTPRFEAALKQVLNTNTRLLVADMRDVTYIGSNGIYALLKAHFRLSQHGGEVVILGARPEIKVTLDLVGVPRRIRCVDSLNEAPAPRHRTCHHA